MSLVTSNKNALIESGIAAATFLAADKLLYSQPLDMKNDYCPLVQIIYQTWELVMFSQWLVM